MTSINAPKSVAKLKTVSAATLRPATLPDGTKHQLTVGDWSRLSLKVRQSRGGCWVWSGNRLPTGYGVFSLKRRTVYPHRIMYMIFVGDIPAGLHIDHLCRNRACCNPAHLEPVTCAENLRRSPIQITTIQAQKTECHRGHPLSGDNLSVSPRGHRTCRACEKIDNANRYAKGKAALQASSRAPVSPSRAGTYCRNGHERTAENTYTNPAGQHKCRQCKAEYAARRYAEAKAPRDG